MSRRYSNLYYRPWHLSLRTALCIVAASGLLALFSRYLVDPINQLPIVSWVSGFVIGLELAQIRPSRWALVAGLLLADGFSWHLTHTPINQLILPNAMLGADTFWQSLTGNPQNHLPHWLAFCVSSLYIWAMLSIGWITRWLMNTNKIRLDLLKAGDIIRLLVCIGPILAFLPVIVFFVANSVIVLAFVSVENVILTDTASKLLDTLGTSHTAWLTLAAQQTKAHALTVWSSHCTSALLLAPILLRLIPQAPFAQQERVVMVPLTAFLIVSITAHVGYIVFSTQYLQREFNTLATDFHHELSNELEKVSVQLKAFKAFFESGSRINEDSFDKFYAGDARNQHASHQVDIFWLSRISHEQRMPFERHLASAGIPLPNIKYPASNHADISAAPHHLYFPVTYVSNKRLRNQITGYDCYADPTLKTALLKAANSGGISVASLIPHKGSPHFFQRKNAISSSSLFLIASVFHEQSHSSFGTGAYQADLLPQLTHQASGKAQQQTHNVGFIAARIQLNVLIQQLSHTLSHPIAIEVEQVMSNGTTETLLDNPLNQRDNTLVTLKDSLYNQVAPISYHFMLAERIFAYRHNIVIGDQLFRLRISPLLSTITELQHQYQWLYLSIVVIVTVCFSFMTLHLSARDLLVRQIVVGRTEHLRESTYRAEIISQAKTRFLASMSHEFMTPLNAIIGFTRRVIDKEKDNLAPRHLSALESVEANGLKLLGIIHNLINITDLESGQVKLTVTQVNIDDCITQALQPLLRIIERKKLTLRRFISYEFPIIADEKRFIELLHSLLKNAVDYTDSGTVTLFVKPERRHQRRGVLIRIQDTGCGLSKEQQKKLLDENTSFKDITSRVNQRIGGVGAGFNSAKALIKLHGGELNLHSKVNKGTSVYIWLPAHQSTGDDERLPIKGNHLSI